MVKDIAEKGLTTTAAISEISKVVVGVFDIRELLDRVVETIVRLTNVEACSIWLIDPDNKIRIKSAKGYHEPLLGLNKESLLQYLSQGKVTSIPPLPAEYAIGEGITGRIAAKGEIIRTTGLNRHREHPDWQGKYDTIQWASISQKSSNIIHQNTCVSFFGAPLQVRDNIVGVLKIENKRESDTTLAEAFTEEDEQVFTILTNVIAVTIENQRLALERHRHAEETWRLVSARLAHKIGNQNFALKLILGNLDIPSQYLEQINECKDCCKAIDAILLEATEFAQQPKLNKELCNIAELVASVTKAHPTVDWENAKILHNRCEPDPYLTLDRDKIRHVLMELLENSHGFIKSRAVINIKTGRAEPDILKTINLTDNYCLIEYTDNGPGIPESKKEAVFQPFVSLRQGTGLGLSIVRQIIDAHEGKIIECGIFGKGVRFLICLPINQK